MKDHRCLGEMTRVQISLELDACDFRVITKEAAADIRKERAQNINVNWITRRRDVKGSNRRDIAFFFDERPKPWNAHGGKSMTLGLNRKSIKSQNREKEDKGRERCMDLSGVEEH